MRRMRMRAILLAALCSVLQAGTISLTPLQQEVQWGSSARVDVRVDGVQDLYAFQFDVRFTPAGIFDLIPFEHFESIFKNRGVGLFQGILDEENGVLRAVSDSLAGSQPGISLDGFLITMYSPVWKTGDVSISLENVLLLDSNLEDISVDIGPPAEVRIPPIPEPGAAGLTIFGLVGFGLWAYKRPVRN
jgi:hypothetical protein